MTDEEGEEGPSPRKILVAAIAIVIVAVLTVGLIRVIGTFLVLSGSQGEAVYHVGCEEYDGPLRDEWIISDNISSYEEIPQNQKSTLSNESVERLKDLSPRFYNATEYTELSEERKSVFRSALNGSVEVKTREEASYTDDIIYRGEVYECDFFRDSGA